jgi:hypothetical protein
MFLGSRNPSADIADVFVNRRALDQWLAVFCPTGNLLIVVVMMRRTAPLVVMVSDGYENNASH